VPGFTEYFDLLLTKQKTRKPKIYRHLNDFVGGGAEREGFVKLSGTIARRVFQNVLDSDAPNYALLF
jgi:hypothetical protein